MTEERKKIIETGLKALLEEKLETLESAIRHKNDINKEVDRYLGAYRVADKEIDVSPYMSRFNALIDKFWEIKHSRG